MSKLQTIITKIEALTLDEQKELISRVVKNLQEAEFEKIV